MASRQQSLKRKSEDFIYELSENDLSADEHVEDKVTKMQKIDSTVEVEETSKKSCTQLLPDKVTEENEVHNQMKVTKQTSTNEADASVNSEEDSKSLLEFSKTKDKMQIEQVNPVNNEELDIIDINDSDIDNSIEILERNISIVEVSDEDILKSSNVTQEEGEILDVFEVVDEVGATPKIEHDEVPDYIMNISFKNEDIKSCYESKIVKFLSTFPEFEINSEELFINISKKSWLPKSVECEVHSDNLNHKTPRKKHKKKKAKKELFVLDTNPSLNDSNVGVRYSNKFNIEDKKPEEECPQKRSISAQACFNCGEGHALKDCNIPKNFDKINAARQKFASNKNKLTRYHVDEQKFGHLKPGVISEKLRHALGLKKNELPCYIYGMRALGYPPGWLEEAKIVNSSLRLFNIDGGKVKNNNKDKKKGLDPDKIVDYPGFNTPMEKGFYDEFRRYKVNPYSKKTEKHFMLKHFEQLCEENDSETSDIELVENQEMENTEAKKIVEQTPWSCNSSLKDLENQKKNIINQLNTSNNKTNQFDDDDDSHHNESNRPDESGEDHPITAIKGSSLGTPIIKTGSPYMCLPNPDNFSIGVSPVIDFENLPNSTGKYEQMSGVLSKVRSTLKNLENSKS